MKIRPIFVVSILIAAIAGLAFYLLRESAAHKEKALLEVSVIIGGLMNNYWDAVKQGMDQASSDFNVELHFVSLAGENYSREQAAQIPREIENGAMALIVAPSSGETALFTAIAAAAKRTSVVMIESESDDDGVKTSVSAGNEELGRELGRQILAAVAPDEKIVILNPATGAAYETARLKGLTRELADRPTKPDILRITPGHVDPYAEVLDIIDSKKPRVLVALDARSLSLAATAANADPSAGLAVYGIDSMASIVPYLENGIIHCAVVPNAYNMGYLSVKAAASAIQGGRLEKHTKVDYAVVTPVNIYSPENQRVLFPFVK